MRDKILAIEWMYEHSHLYERPNALGQHRDRYFEVYNILFKDNKRPTSCGRCLSQMRAKFRTLKNNLDNMKQYQVYRTEKGNLSFKETEELAYTIHAKTKTAANEALKQLKKDDKKFYE